jgi:dihydrofolate reductase
MASYWPTEMAITNDPIIANKMNTIRKIVFSKTLVSAEWNNTKLIKENIAEEISQLRHQSGKDMAIFGSANLAVTLMQLGSIDEYRIIVNPVILGSGRPLFQGIEDRHNLKLIKTKTFSQKPTFMIGAEIIEQLQKRQDTLFTDYAPFGISLFSWYRKSDNWKVCGRIDYYDPNRLSSNTDFYEYFISLGFDYMPMNNIHFMPIIWINTFTDKSSAGRTKNADVILRITFFFLFN